MKRSKRRRKKYRRKLVPKQEQLVPKHRVGLITQTGDIGMGTTGIVGQMPSGKHDICTYLIPEDEFNGILSLWGRGEEKEYIREVFESIMSSKTVMVLFENQVSTLPWETYTIVGHIHVPFRWGGMITLRPGVRTETTHSRKGINYSAQYTEQATKNHKNPEV